MKETIPAQSSSSSLLLHRLRASIVDVHRSCHDQLHTGRQSCCMVLIYCVEDREVWTGMPSEGLKRRDQRDCIKSSRLSASITISLWEACLSSSQQLTCIARHRPELWRQLQRPEPHFVWPVPVPLLHSLGHGSVSKLQSHSFGTSV